jgi:hypothetical protein
LARIRVAAADDALTRAEEEVERDHNRLVSRENDQNCRNGRAATPVFSATAGGASPDEFAAAIAPNAVAAAAREAARLSGAREVCGDNRNIVAADDATTQLLSSQQEKSVQAAAADASAVEIASTALARVPFLRGIHSRTSLAAVIVAVRAAARKQDENVVTGAFWEASA